MEGANSIKMIVSHAKVTQILARGAAPACSWVPRQITLILLRKHYSISRTLNLSYCCTPNPTAGRNSSTPGDPASSAAGRIDPTPPPTAKSEITYFAIYSPQVRGAKLWQLGQFENSIIAIPNPLQRGRACLSRPAAVRDLVLCAPHLHKPIQYNLPHENELPGAAGQSR